MPSLLFSCILVFLISFILESKYFCCYGDVPDLTKHPGHLKRYGYCGECRQVDEIYRFPPPSEFFRDYVAASSPVIMKGVLKDTKAFKEWTDEFFLNLSIPAEDRVKIQGDRGPLDLIRMHFHQFVKTYNQTNDYMETEVPTYLGQGVPIPLPLECPDVHKIFDYANMWYSKGGTKSPVHTDGSDNLLCMYAGEKEVTLLHPDQYLNKDGIDPRAVAITYMDVDSVNYTKHPDLASIENYHKANISAGDCLYLPYNWIHQVFSYNRNIAINIWWHHPKDVTTIVKNCEQTPERKYTIADKITPRPCEGFLPKEQIYYFLDDLTRMQPGSVEELRVSMLDLLIIGHYYVKIFREPGEGANKINVGKYSDEYMDKLRTHTQVKSQYTSQLIPLISSLDQDKDGLVSHDELYSDKVQNDILPILYKKARSLERIILELMRHYVKTAKQQKMKPIEVKKMEVTKNVTEKSTHQNHTEL